MKPQIRSILPVLGLLLAAGALQLSVSCSARKTRLTPAEQQWLKEHGQTIRIAPLPDSPPIDFVGKDGRHLGLTADYFKLIEQRLGIRFVQVECATWKEIIEKLETHEIDLVGSVQNTEERRQFLRFTKPYQHIPNVILMRKEGRTPANGLQVAVVNGSATQGYLGTHHPEYRLVPVEDAATGLHMLSFREVDAMVADLGVVSYYIEEKGIANLRVAGAIDYPWNLCFASRKDWPLLNSILDKTLAGITPRQRRDIRHKWITLNDTAIIPRERYLKVLGTILLLTLLAIGSIVFWNRILKRQVKHRTRALDESEERFRALVESSNDIVWEMDRLGNCAYASPRVRDILGYDPEEMIGRNLLSLMVEKDSARGVQTLRGATEDTRICEINTHIHKDGRKVVLESSGIAFLDNTGKLAGFRGVSHDITERIKAETALRESEERFRNLVETTSDWIWEIDTSGRYTYASPQVSDLLGYLPAELVGKRFVDLMPPEEAVLKEPLFMDFLEKGAPIHSMVNANIHKDGQTVMLETSGVPFYDKDWNILGYRGIDRDITHRVAAEKLLAFERDLFRSFMEHAPDLIYFKDRNGCFVEVNAAKATEVGSTPGKLIGKSDFDFLPPEEAQQRFNDELNVMRTEKPLQKEEMATTPKGERWYLTTKVPRYGEEGQVVGTFGTSWNITRRKQATEELLSLRNLLGNIVNSMPSILIGVDVDGLVTLWNREAERITGVPESLARGKILEEVFPDLGSEMGREISSIVGRKMQHREHIPCTIDNQQRFVDVTVYSITTDGTEGAVIRIDDVTDRVLLEEMMMQSEKMMSVGGLAAGMAHEINNPLAGILQNLQVLRSRVSVGSSRNKAAAKTAGTSFEAIQAYMEERGLPKIMDSIAEAGQRAAKIVDNMLSFSRKDGGNFELHSLEELLERCLELAANEYNLKKRFGFRNIRIVREYGGSPGAVSCEAGQIQQVILNLLSNSAQAMADNPPEDPRITLHLGQEDGMALIEIEDNGPGMDAEIRKRVFEPFFTTKGVGHGTGLGLSVSYFIITENHRGTMGVHSAPGKGARFSIRIPIHPCQAKPNIGLGS